MTYLPDEHTYSKEHLWIKEFENNIYVGFTNHFIKQVGMFDLVDVRDGISLKKGEVCGIVYEKSIRKIKSKSKNMVMPVSGTILSVNMNVFLDPTLFNHEPYRHWVIIISVKNPDELKELLSTTQYRALIKT